MRQGNLAQRCRKAHKELVIETRRFDSSNVLLILQGIQQNVSILREELPARDGRLMKQTAPGARGRVGRRDIHWPAVRPIIPIRTA